LDISTDLVDGETLASTPVPGQRRLFNLYLVEKRLEPLDTGEPTHR
jgi:hypothetical protein